MAFRASFFAALRSRPRAGSPLVRSLPHGDARPLRRFCWADIDDTSLVAGAIGAC